MSGYKLHRHKQPFLDDRTRTQTDRYQEETSIASWRYPNLSHPEREKVVRENLRRKYGSDSE